MWAYEEPDVNLTLTLNMEQEKVCFSIRIQFPCYTGPAVLLSTMSFSEMVDVENVK